MSGPYEFMTMAGKVPEEHKMYFEGKPMFLWYPGIKGIEFAWMLNSAYSAGQLAERKRLTPAIREAARVLSACAFDAPEDQAAAAEIERVAEELERETT